MQYTYKDIPKQMGNEESKLWAGLFVKQQRLAIAEAEYFRAVRKKEQYYGSG